MMIPWMLSYRFGVICKVKKGNYERRGLEKGLFFLLNKMKYGTLVASKQC